MFNLKSQKHINDIELLRIEMKAFDIVKDADGYSIKIGDTTTSVPTLQKCQEALNQGILEIKERLFYSWQDLNQIILRILNQSGRNRGNLDNLLFLNAIKKSYRLSSIFPEFNEITANLVKLLDTDIEQTDTHLINHFNTEYIDIHSLHHLMMNEMYRKKLISRFMRLTKQSQISGPWANLDLPMKERVWEYDEEEQSYFDNRMKSRRQQTRYNSEDTAQTGFYFVWNDLTRSPYSFDNFKKDSPYKSRFQLTIA
ncbi:MAG: hypothetical protein ACE5H1_07920 [Thermodesulfobacteriota bacterium]